MYPGRVFNCPIHGSVGDQDGDDVCWRCEHEEYMRQLELEEKLRNQKVVGHLLVVERRSYNSAKVRLAQKEITHEELANWAIAEHAAHCRYLSRQPFGKLGIEAIIDNSGVVAEIYGFVVPLLANKERVRQAIKAKLAYDHVAISLP